MINSITKPKFSQIFIEFVIDKTASMIPLFIRFCCHKDLLKCKTKQKAKYLLKINCFFI